MYKCIYELNTGDSLFKVGDVITIATGEVLDLDDDLKIPVYYTDNNECLTESELDGYFELV